MDGTEQKVTELSPRRPERALPEARKQAGKKKKKEKVKKSVGAEIISWVLTILAGPGGGPGHPVRHL